MTSLARLDGKNFCRTADDLDPESVNKALNDVEEYVSSVENAHRGDQRAKWRWLNFYCV